MAKKPVTGKPLESNRIPMKTAANPSQQTKKTTSIPTNFEARMAEKGFQQGSGNAYYAPGTPQAKAIKNLKDKGYTRKPSGTYSKDYVTK